MSTAEQIQQVTPEYAFKFSAQAWRRDSYYVGSSQPVKKLTVIGSTEDEAKTEARRVLGPIDSNWYWRFWLLSSKDVRLVNRDDEDVLS